MGKKDNRSVATGNLLTSLSRSDPYSNRDFRLFSTARRCLAPIIWLSSGVIWNGVSRSVGTIHLVHLLVEQGHGNCDKRTRRVNLVHKTQNYN
jgi:hypothetical protein